MYDPEYYKIQIEEALEKLGAIDEAKSQKQRFSGMDYYVPNAVQHKAHQSTARTILLCAANRIGKSTFGCMELCYALTRKYPDWFPVERRFTRPVRAAISATEFPIITRVIEPKIKQYLPRDYYIMRRKGGYVSRIECRDGSTVDILTLEMDDSAYESADWDIVWEDEPQNQRKREGLIRGLIDRRGLEIITFTPLTEPWMKNELIDKADGKRIECFFGSMRENKFDIQGKPILSEEAIAEFEASLPDEIKEIRVEGQFFTLRGRVYKEFGEPHIEDFTYEYPDPVICVLDPHDRQPHHVIWAYIDRIDDIHVDYEWIGHVDLEELASVIRSIEKKRGYKMRKRIIDPNFGRKPARPGVNTSVMQELSRHGASFYEANDDRELGHMIVRDYLHYNRRQPVSFTNKPKLFFSRERCPRTISSLRNLQYDDWVGKGRSEKDPKEDERQKETHGADCVRYLCISKPHHTSIQQEMDEQEVEGVLY